MKLSAFSVLTCFAALTFLGDDCDPPKAGSKKPGEAKLAGWEPGEVRVCALTGSDKGPDAVTIKAALGGEPMHDFTAKKTDKGYCEYLQPDWKTYGFSFPLSMAGTDGVTLTEVGVYFMESDSDNPSFDDFKYTKAVKGKDGVFKLMLAPDIDMPTVKFKSP